ncbi:hypothetical protein C8F01DRAFT_1260648 [Mycena amicta]|nr:hypothetical protein C8F01DRAFT_1260648 [Mycena amicta]
MFLATAIVFSVYAAFAHGQSTIVCNPTGTLCFNQVFDKATQITIGLALPPNGALNADFLAQLSVPIPYGFAGFGPADGSKTVVPQSSVEGFVTRFSTSGSSGAVVSAMLIQQSILSSDKTKLIPIDAGGVITVSTLSTGTPNSAKFVFRCQGCFGAGPDAHSGPLLLSVFSSPQAPEYPAVDALNATLPLSRGVIVGSVRFADVAALQTDDYLAYLKVAGLV